MQKTVGAEKAMKPFVRDGVSRGRRRTVHSEEKHWFYRTGIELTPWSSDEEVARFNKRKRELQEQDAKEQGTSRLPQEEVTDDSSHDEAEREPEHVRADAGHGQVRDEVEDHREDRHSNAHSTGIFDGEWDLSSPHCGEDRIDKPVQLPVQLLRNRAKSKAAQRHGLEPVQEDS